MKQYVVTGNQELCRDASDDGYVGAVATESDNNISRLC